MLGVGGDLCGSSSPTPLPKQEHLEQAAQDPVQAGFEYLRRRRYIYHIYLDFLKKYFSCILSQDLGGRRERS